MPLRGQRPTCTRRTPHGRHRTETEDKSLPPSDPSQTRRGHGTFAVGAFGEDVRPRRLHREDGHTTLRLAGATKEVSSRTCVVRERTSPTEIRPRAPSVRGVTRACTLPGNDGDCHPSAFRDVGPTDQGRDAQADLVPTVPKPPCGKRSPSLGTSVSVDAMASCHDFCRTRFPVSALSSAHGAGAPFLLTGRPRAVLFLRDGATWKRASGGACPCVGRGDARETRPMTSATPRWPRCAPALGHPRYTLNFLLRAGVSGSEQNWDKGTETSHAVPDGHAQPPPPSPPPPDGDNG